MMSSRFDLSSISKTLNLFLLRFNEWSEFENLDTDHVEHVNMGLNEITNGVAFNFFIFYL